MPDPTGTLRILHLSDLHARVDWAADQRRVIDALFADIAEIQREKSFDLIVISGDVAYSGKAEEYALARELMLERLLDVTGLPRDHFVLVPGNHDVDRHLIDPYAETGWREACAERRPAMTLMADPNALARATTRLTAWTEFCDAFFGTDQPVPVGPLGRVHTIDSPVGTVRIAALNSAWRSGGDSDRGQLLVGDLQLDPALRALDGADIPVAVLHHPPDWLHPYDADALRIELAARGTLVLCGHEHQTDPMSVRTTRGEVVYSRAGSLFSTIEHLNAYSVIDISPRERRTLFRLRTWWPDRRVFAHSSDVAHGGEFELDWPVPAREVAGVAVRYSGVVETLAERVQFHSALADRIEAAKPFDDLVVPPRFLGTPYGEATAVLALDPQKKLERADPIEEIKNHRVLVVAGEPESGVSTALLWTLKHWFDIDATKVPVTFPLAVPFGKTQFERIVRRELRRYGLDVTRSDIPPLAVAIDDVTAEPGSAVSRLAEVISARPLDCYILGCREHEYETIARALQEARIPHGTVFLAPFGRREIRELHLRLVGPERLELVDRVTAVVGKEGLPRSPFVLSALVAVLADQQDVTSLNESGVLEGYVDLLLSDAFPDLEQLGMDKRRREHLLGSFAARLRSSQELGMSELDAEAYLQEYFRSQGWLSASPGKVLDSLVRRRILAVDRGLIRFRHPALFHLFEGAAYHADPDFAKLLRDDAGANAAALRHAAGLKRDDRDLLAFVLSLAEEGLAGVDEVDFAIYQGSGDGASVATKQLNSELEVSGSLPSGAELENQLDHWDDMQAGRRENGGTLAHAAIEPIGAAVDLLSQVLRNTELSTDLDLKQRALRVAVQGWATIGVLIAEDIESDGLTRAMTARLARLADGNVTDEQVDELVPLVTDVMRQILAVAVAVGMAAAMASKHLEAVVEEAVADTNLMQEPIIAFYLTMLYCALGRPDWPDQLERCYRQHESQVTLAAALRGWAVVQYRATPNENEAARVEAVLARIYALEPEGRGAAAIVERGAAHSQTLNKLRQLRAAARRAVTSEESKIDPLAVEESTPSRAAGSVVSD